jgi:hypothetical protein
LFEAGKVRLEELATRDHNHINCEPSLGVLPEDLSHQAFSPIPCHRVPNLPARHEAESCYAGRVRGDDERDVAAMPTASDGEGPLELYTPANPAISVEALGLHDPAPAAVGAWWLRRSGRRRNGQPLPALGPATLQDEPPVFRAHAHQEAVRATATTPVWLERTFHDRVSLCARSKWRRNLDSSEGSMEVSILTGQRPARTVHVPELITGTTRRLNGLAATIPQKM